MFLDRIVTQTYQDLEQRKHTQPVAEVRQRAAVQPEPRNLLQALQPVSALDTTIRLIAEVKRASPSKGMLAPHLDPVELAQVYEANGAAVISVLTEPHFFLGSPDYLTAIKQAVQIPILRKDFIIDEYQVYEARAWGADGILLICAILNDTQLQHLLQVAHEQHMSCLVEVHSREEAQRAVIAGAKIIGVNNRDLATFQMNPHLIRELRSLIPADCIVVAESGIHTANDARRLARYDVHAMLVGESLVVAEDVAGQMHALLQGANKSIQVKICGLLTPGQVDAALEAEADMLGLVFYEPSRHYISPQQAKELIERTAAQYTSPFPDFVGLFVNSEAKFINDIAQQLDLHYIQLHGNESPDFCQHIDLPIIKAIPSTPIREVNDVVNGYMKNIWRILLDTPTPEWGGSGVPHDWDIARTIAQEMPIILAGGLTPANVVEAVQHVRPWGVDVSSGVETDGQKDLEKIRAFVDAAHR